MKILSCILSLSILILSCITCEDLPEFTDTGLAKISSTNFHKPDNQTEKDNCSPLCTCNCCGQPVLSTLSFASFPFIKVQAVSKKKIDFKNQFVSDYVQNIWQPPKLDKFLIG
ncbi:DUF6660 family protein [Pedobacter paludis]|uniref:Uncharacterized protein n=1 Tax=Pedobacter paludis TaxID=2203212 RepID=A0A317EYV4_9SPHI|nr:DUF6660 family protein [Pedobacter paludis]PWS31622.1 hypothetical protein DF947_13620 [Pedobacter paludis]